MNLCWLEIKGGLLSGRDLLHCKGWSNESIVLLLLRFDTRGQLVLRLILRDEIDSSKTILSLTHLTRVTVKG